MSMQDSLHIPEDDLVQYALGTLKDSQLGTMTAHVSMCNVCRSELGKIHLDLASLAWVEPQAELPAGARDRFLKRLDSDSAAESKFLQMDRKSPIFAAMESFVHWLQTPMPLRILSGALAAALLIVGYDDLSNIHQIRQLTPAMNRFEKQNAELTELKNFLQGVHAQQVTLREKPQVNRTPEGHTLYSPTTGQLVFTASNMSAPPTGKAYELWILPVAGGKPIPAGTFIPDMQGNGAIIFPEIPSDVQAAGFGVTVENAEGSPVPTSPIILSGQ
jgi:hypothetical protein